MLCGFSLCYGVLSALIMAGSTHRAGVLCLLVRRNQSQAIHNLESSHQIYNHKYGDWSI